MRTELERWLRGEFRTDGFQSPWLRATLKARGEKNTVMAMPKPRQVRKLPAKPTQSCKNCAAPIWSGSETGYCKGCYAQLFRRKERPTCRQCGKELKLENQTGFCNKHKWSRQEAA